MDPAPPCHCHGKVLWESIEPKAQLEDREGSGLELDDRFPEGQLVVRSCYEEVDKEMHIGFCNVSL